MLSTIYKREDSKTDDGGATKKETKEKLRSVEQNKIGMDYLRYGCKETGNREK